jgi:hypothetical protein
MQPFAAIRQECKKATSSQKTPFFLISCLKNRIGQDLHTGYSAAIKHFIERCKKTRISSPLTDLKGAKLLLYFLLDGFCKWSKPFCPKIS